MFGANLLLQVLDYFVFENFISSIGTFIAYFAIQFEINMILIEDTIFFFLVCVCVYIYIYITYQIKNCVCLTNILVSQPAPFPPPPPKQKFLTPNLSKNDP